MESDTWNQKEIQELLKNYVPLKIDIDNNRKISNKYSANRIPYILIVDATGEVVYNETGYKNKNEMLKVLDKYKLNTSAFQQDYSLYFTKPTSKEALNIAEKYLDVAIYGDAKTKSDYVKLSASYLKKVKKLAKDKSSYKNNFKNRVNLLSGPYKYLIRGKHEKALKELQKNFNQVDLNKKDKELYQFISFVTNNKLGNKNLAKQEYEKLKKTENFKIWILKSRKI